MATGENGRFALQKPAGMLPIRVSLLGYESRVLMADEGNLDTIILIAHDLAIDEVRVGQSNQVLSASGATYYPSHTVKRQAFTGLMCSPSSGWSSWYSIGRTRASAP
ncbi:MAG: hypothetical protein ACFNUE_00155 [Bacteroides sp.]